MSASADLQEVASPPGESVALPKKAKRRLLPRFRLRLLLAFAVLFCLFFAWIGRNVVRMREEEAAIETLLQANATIAVLGEGILPKEYASPPVLDPAERTFGERFGRAVGWTEPPRISRIRIEAQKPNEIVPRALAALLVFPDLRTVELRGPAFDDRAIEQVAAIESLRSLSLENTRVTADGLSKLSSHESLRSLSLDADFWGELTRAAASLKNLERVSLSGMAIDQVGIAAVASLPKLKELSISSVPLYYDLLHPLEAATSLYRLSLHGSRDRNPGAVEIPNLPQLEILDANDVSIVGLPSSPKLRSLDAPGVTDEMLADWEAPPSLRHLALYPPVTTEAAEKFWTAHPDCALTYHSTDGQQIHYRAKSLFR